MTMKKRCSVTGLGIIALIFACIASGFAQEVPAGFTQKNTLDNLLAAYNGERNANVRYLAFAGKADQEGYGQVAGLFRAAARAEQVHFEHHAKVIESLGGVPKATMETPEIKSTKENVEAAMKGELYESTVMYPEFLAKAKKDKLTAAVGVFENALEAEIVHAKLYKTALDDLEAWKGTKKDFFVCPTCGNVVYSIPGPFCPICTEDTKKFIPVS